MINSLRLIFDIGFAYFKTVVIYDKYNKELIIGMLENLLSLIDLSE